MQKFEASNRVEIDRTQKSRQCLIILYKNVSVLRKLETVMIEF